MHTVIPANSAAWYFKWAYAVNNAQWVAIDLRQIAFRNQNKCMSLCQKLLLLWERVDFVKLNSWMFSFAVAICYFDNTQHIDRVSPPFLSIFSRRFKSLTLGSHRKIEHPRELMRWTRMKCTLILPHNFLICPAFNWYLENGLVHSWNILRAWRCRTFHGKI